MAIQGIDQFRDFADNVREIDVDAAIRRAVEATGEDYIDTLTGIIKREETSKGGTLDSRTSPYSPGTSNDSSDDSLHISENTAWEIQFSDPQSIVVRPKEEVADRAKFLEYGTRDHGPRGDTPMYFNVNGMTIVVSDAPPDATLGERFDAEPGEVAGVEAQNFFSRAAQSLRANERLKRNLEEELEREVQEAMA